MPNPNFAGAIYVGPSIAADGDYTTLRGGRSGEGIFSACHAGYYEAVYRGNCYSAGNAAAITFGTALTATGVTYHLYNPFNSGKNLVVLKCAINIITASTSGSIVYCANVIGSAAAPTTPTKLTVVNNLLGSANVGVGQALSVAGLPAVPTQLRPVAGATATLANVTSQFIDWIDGEFIVGPGCVLSIQGITIVGTGLCGMSWEEVLI
jgi:hypothetical protein